MIESIPLVLTGIGIIASILYYTSVLRNTNKARQRELIFQRLRARGTQKELDDVLGDWKKGADKTDGVKYVAHWIPHSSKWHHAVFYEAESYTKVRESWRSVSTGRDYSKLTHGAMELFVKRGT